MRKMTGRELLVDFAKFCAYMAIFAGLLALCGCAAEPTKPDPVRYVFVCAFVAHGIVTLDDHPQKYPSATMVCDRK